MSGISIAAILTSLISIAERVPHQPDLAKLPFYQFDGYVSERLMTCGFHSAFVAIAHSSLRHRLWPGLGGPMAAHWAANFPISLMAWEVGRPGTTSLGGARGVVAFVGAVRLLTRYTLAASYPGTPLRHLPLP